MTFPIAVDLEGALAAAGVGVWSWDPKTDQMSMTEAFLNTLGHGSSGRILPQALIHEADRAAFGDALRGAALPADAALPCDCALRVRAADGSYRLLRLRGAAERDEAGDTLRVTGLHEDIVQCQCADERLRLMEEISGTGAWEMTLEPFSFNCSPAASALLGLAPGALPGTQAACLDLFHPGERARVAQAIRVAMRRRGQGGHRAGPFRARIWLADGAARPCVFHAAVQRSASGGSVGLIGTIADATGQNDAALRRKQARKLELMGQFSSGVAHDFNNFLSVIMGNLDLVREAECPADARRYVDEAIAAAHKGEELTRALLGFVHQERVVPGPANLDRTIGDMSGLLQHILPEAIRVEMRTEEKELWPVEIDISAFESALLTLVMNARDSMQGSGTLTIETANHLQPEPSGRDDGSGLAAGYYVMVSLSHTGVEPGQSEPLARADIQVQAGRVGRETAADLVRELVSQAGGHVCMLCHEGGWCRIRLFFPVLALPAKAKAVAAEATGGRFAGRVLLVEDEPLVMRMMERRLCKLGLDCVTAASGAEALRAFEKNGPFDILITDIVMPGSIQGYGLVTHLRRQQPQLPVILMSGYASEDIPQGNACAPGAIRLMKPVSKDALVEALHALLAGARGARF